MKKLQNLGNSSIKNPPYKIKKTYIEFEERVRYSETDKMGIAHNKNYFEWFEIGRTKFCRFKKIPYSDIENMGYYLVVVEAFCRYKNPLKYDEPFIIRVSLEERTQKKFIFAYELVSKNGKKSIAEGYTVHIVTNAKGKVSNLPEDVLENFL